MRRACKLDIWSKVKNSAPSMAIGGPTDACLNMDSNRDGWTTTSISVPQMIKVWTKMTRLQLMMQVLSHDLTKNLTGHWFTYGIPKHQKWIVRPIAFRVYEMLWSKIDHLAKKAVLWKNLKMAYFLIYASGLPDFGRLWMSNHWHQVKLWDVGYVEGFKK